MLAERPRAGDERVKQARQLVADRWDNFTAPQAKAFHLLKELQVGAPPDSRLRQAGELVFDELGGSPCSVCKSVHLKEDLTASLLQARLLELNLPIKVKVGPLS